MDAIIRRNRQGSNVSLLAFVIVPSHGHRREHRIGLHRCDRR
jgi:hypothetical protein